MGKIGYGLDVLWTFGSDLPIRAGLFYGTGSNPSWYFDRTFVMNVGVSLPTSTFGSDGARRIAGAVWEGSTAFFRELFGDKRPKQEQLP